MKMAVKRTLGSDRLQELLDIFPFAQFDLNDFDEIVIYTGEYVAYEKPKKEK